MSGPVITLLALAALLASVAPALALSEAMCSAIGQGLGNLSGPGGGVAGGIVSQNCGTSSSATAPVVATPEPLGALAVAVGLLGARLLRRR